MSAALSAFFAVLSAFFGRPVTNEPWVRVRVRPLGMARDYVLVRGGVSALAFPVPDETPPGEGARIETDAAFVAFLPVGLAGLACVGVGERVVDLAALDAFLDGVPPVVGRVTCGEHTVDPHTLRALLLALDPGGRAEELTIQTVYLPEGLARVRRTRIEVAGAAWTFQGAVVRSALAYDPKYPAVVCCARCGERRGRGVTEKDALQRALAAGTVERLGVDGAVAHYCPDCARDVPPVVEHPDDDRDPLELAGPVRTGSGTWRAGKAVRS